MENLLPVCPDCGEKLDLLLDFEALGKAREQIESFPDFHMGRYAPLLPLPGLGAMAYGIGGTPLLFAGRLGEAIGAPGLFLKDDTRNPSASLKDRATLAVLLAAREQGAETVATASTGNAGASLSALAARLGMKAVVYTPASAPPAKLEQIRAHGAKLVRVDGNYDRAYELCAEDCLKNNWISRSTGFNPWCTEGKKTVALEIAEQLGWTAPDLVYVPTGDGSILGAVHKGFSDLLQLGILTSMPRLVAVQAEGSAAIHDAWKEERDIQPVSSDTLADSISVDMPADGTKALRALRKSKGFAITVSDPEILGAMSRLARLEGVLAEPAAAASLAGLSRAVKDGLQDSTQKAVCLVTGHGLKDREALERLP
jgi:threonine synthase